MWGSSKRLHLLFNQRCELQRGVSAFWSALNPAEFIVVETHGYGDRSPVALTFMLVRVSRFASFGFDHHFDRAEHLDAAFL